MVDDVEIISNTKMAFRKLSAPLVMLSIFQVFYSFVDLFWASQLTSEAFFAIGVTAPLVLLVVYSGDSIGIGTNSIISRDLGKHDDENAYNSILHGIIISAIISLIFMLSSFFLKDILVLMHVGESIDYAIAYISPIFLFSSVFVFSSLFANTLQAEGNSRMPTILLIVSNILNLILDPILMFTLGWGVKGAAYASIISSLLVVVSLLYWYLSGRSKVALNFKYFKQGIVYEIFVVAVPNFVVKVLWCLAILYVNSILILQLGELGVLLYSTSSQIESLILSPVDGHSKALVTIGGHLFGADEMGKLKDIYRYALKISFIFTLVCSVAFFFLRDYGFALFSVTNAETSVFYIALFGIFILLGESISSVSSKVLDGMGKSYYLLILEIATIIFELLTITLLVPVLTSGVCVLIGIFLSELLFAFVYYIVLMSIFNKKNKIEDRIQSILES